MLPVYNHKATLRCSQSQRRRRPWQPCYQSLCHTHASSSLGCFAMSPYEDCRSEAVSSDPLLAEIIKRRLEADLKSRSDTTERSNCFDFPGVLENANEETYQYQNVVRTFGPHCNHSTLKTKYFSVQIQANSVPRQPPNIWSALTQHACICYPPLFSIERVRSKFSQVASWLRWFRRAFSSFRFSWRLPILPLNQCRRKQLHRSVRHAR